MGKYFFVLVFHTFWVGQGAYGSSYIPVHAYIHLIHLTDFETDEPERFIRTIVGLLVIPVEERKCAAMASSPRAPIAPPLDSSARKYPHS